jgi:hypothetical protein
MKPYLKQTRATNISSNNTPLTYAAAYGWTSGQVKTNSCIHICSFGGNINGVHTKVGNNIYLVTNSDYHKYCKYVGVKPSTLYLYIHTPDAVTEDDAGYTENVLDCSMCCLNECIVVIDIFPQSNDFYDCFQTMLPGHRLEDGTLLKPTQISISWGCSENQSSDQDRTLLPELIKNCGVDVFSASGDYGATNGTNKLMVDHPSCIPHIIGVGGTTITSMNPFTEKVWNQNGLATGGGYSRFFSKPSYQTSSGLKRMIPDITAVGDPTTGACLFIRNVKSGGYGGTSMSAPFVCSLYAIIKYKHGVIKPLYSFLYKANCFNDIIVGNNKDNGKGYNATKGIDPCSGLGSIQWNKLIRYLSPNIPEPTTPTPKPTTPKPQPKPTPSKPPKPQPKPPKPAPKPKELSLTLQMNKSYPFPFPYKHKSDGITIQNKMIRGSKLGTFMVSAPSFRIHINVIRNTNVRFALTT